MEDAVEWWMFPNTVDAVAFHYSHHYTTSGMEIYDFFAAPWEHNEVWSDWLDCGACTVTHA